MHTILKQNLHIELNGTESEGLVLQRRLPGLCQHWLVPAIERVMELCAPADGYLYIDRLEIDAGALTLESFEHELAGSVAQALERAIREKITVVRSSPTISSGNIRFVTKQQSINEAFIYFLKTGALPWSFHLPAGFSLEQVILVSWQEAEKTGFNPLPEGDVVLLMLALVTIRKRLICQFSPVFLKALLSLLSPRGLAVMDGILHTLRSSTGLVADTNYFEKLAWEMMFANLSTGNVPAATNIVREVWMSMPLTTPGYEALTDVLEQRWPESTGKAGVFEEPERTSISEGRYSGREVKSSERTESVRSDASESGRTPIRGDRYPESGEGIDAREGIYIENAGLVLLHPFLPQFLAALGIVTEDKLLQPDRALCLLHYLTTGRIIAPEYELTLPKILCNVPLETPVESGVALTSAEQEEATALLRAVIRHWEALRNTTPDGLRGTFLLRAGKVSSRDGDWLLEVESMTCDILLEQLPWGISMIRLPWMERMLWVEWK